MERLDKKAVWLFFFQTSFFFTVIAFVTFFISLEVLSRWFSDIFSFAGSVWVALIGAFLFSYVWSFLFYKFYKYELGGEVFKKEYGVISKKYVSIPYGRIQNIDIHRSLMMRILGLSMLKIQTAGGSGAVGSEATLPGLSSKRAEEIREVLIRRMKDSSSSQGL